MGQHKAERREIFFCEHTGFAEGLYSYSSISSSTHNPRFEVGAIWTKNEISGKKISFVYEIGELMSYRKHVMYSGEPLCRDLVRNVRETGWME